MNTTIEAPFEVIENKKSFIEEKMSDIEKKYSLGVTQANVYFKLDDGSGPHNVLAEIRLRIPGKDIFVSSSESDDIKAFAKAYDSAKRAARKQKEILNERQSPIKELNNTVNFTYENDIKNKEIY